MDRERFWRWITGGWQHPAMILRMDGKRNWKCWTLRLRTVTKSSADGLRLERNINIVTDLLKYCKWSVNGLQVECKHKCCEWSCWILLLNKEKCSFEMFIFDWEQFLMLFCFDTHWNTLLFFCFNKWGANMIVITDSAISYFHLFALNADECSFEMLTFDWE